jgi:hypothetical protein
MGNQHNSRSLTLAPLYRRGARTADVAQTARGVGASAPSAQRDLQVPADKLNSGWYPHEDPILGYDLERTGSESTFFRFRHQPSTHGADQQSDRAAKEDPIDST